MKNNKIYRFLTSIRLAIFLLVVIAVLCVLCTLIPQNESQAVYSEKYGEFIASIIQLFGFDHVLSSFWMYLTGMIFAVNLGLCTLARFQWAMACSKKQIRIDAWGSPLLHVGLCLILVGAVLSIGFGRQIYYEIPVGKTAKVSGNSGIFELQVDDFSIEYYEDNISPKQYRSSLTAKSEEKEAVSLITEVNAPAKYDGVTIIQQAYGWQTQITLSSDSASRQIEVKDNEWVTLFGEGEDAVSLGIAFYPDYAEVDGEPRLMSNQDKNPYILWAITKGEIPVASDVLALGESTAIFESLGITFDGYDYYTGLQIKFDPGIPVIFAGFFLVCIGLMIRYVFVKKQSE
ncbi:MAG: cytochrome c biogenesis protein ResB [Lachnospiraceae bacterium]|nr:cytochrome c biogenesis protein ResB [Lachnospiraceae bacterium]